MPGNKRYAIIAACLLLLTASSFLSFKWFSRPSGSDRSNEDVVRKIQIISRLLSGAAAPAIIDRDLHSLDALAAEAFRDRQIVSFCVTDSADRVIYECSSPNYSGKVSLFETPINAGRKKIGTLITRFTFEASHPSLSWVLGKTVTVQLALLSVMLLLNILYDRKARKVIAAPAAGEQRPSAAQRSRIFLPDADPAVAETAAIAPLLVANKGPARPADNSVPETAEIVSDSGAEVHLCPPVQAAAVESSDEPEKSASETAATESIAGPTDKTAPVLPVSVDAFPPLLAVCTSLQSAAESLNNQVQGRKQQARQFSRLAEQIHTWQHNLDLNSQRTTTMLASCTDILRTAEEQLRAGPAEPSGTTAGLLEAVRRVVHELELELTRPGRSAAIVVNDPDGLSTSSDESVAVAAEYLHQSLDVVRHQTFPAIAAALRSDTETDGHLERLIGQMNDLGSRTDSLKRFIAGFQDSLESLRLVARKAANGQPELAQSLDELMHPLAQEMERLIAAMKGETLAMGESANEAVATGRWATSGIEASRQRIASVCTAMEDVSAMIGLAGEYLPRSRSSEASSVTAEEYLPESGPLPQLHEQIIELEQHAGKHAEEVTARLTHASQMAASLKMAADTVRMAAGYQDQVVAAAKAINDELRAFAAEYGADSACASAVFVEKQIASALADLVSCLPDSAATASSDT